MAEKLLRVEVAKHEKLFIGYVKAHGADAIRELLSTGKTGTYKLTVLKNKKDRYQMMQLLGLVKEKDNEDVEAIGQQLTTEDNAVATK